MSSTQFHVTEESWGRHYRAVTDSKDGGKRHFFIENSQFSSQKPDITIHDGADINDSVIGLSKFRRLSSDCDVTLIEDEQTNKTDWVPLIKKGLVSASYSFYIPIQGQLSHLVWKKTRSMGSHSSPYANMKLVDEDSQNVLAVFSSDTYSLTAGRLDMTGDYGERVDRMVLLTGLAVRERQRRQNKGSVRARRDSVFTVGAAGGGAGSGGGC
ncbi:hypothetical protein NUU61_004814 [Penicillium alfredii]|uniref:Uncharacterized protein n=1 Tax=Penicillium alfredii TaxID=1506179 RepID=A0A9W9K6Z3_9EURO|nr:uncharacterized protein NUU61_004814 [Penicillium alfredii]KAJ5095458.1 hypothetical protein NUU61_004814 [Penicillium alfredii]